VGGGCLNHGGTEGHDTSEESGNGLVGTGSASVLGESRGGGGGNSVAGAGGGGDRGGNGRVG
jgi:hypothetical protein